MQIEIQEQLQTESIRLPLDTVDGPGSYGARPGEIRHATWLSDGLLLVAGTAQIEGTCWPAATLIVGGKHIPAEVEALSYDVPDGRPTDGPRSTLFLVRCDPDACTGEVPQGLVLGSRPGAPAFGPADLPPGLADLSILLRDTVSGLDADSRSRVMQFLVSASGNRLSGLCAARTSRSLFAVREALRERFPGPTLAKGEPLGGNINSFFAIDRNSFYMRGWLASTDSPMIRVTAVSPEGCRIELLDQLFRHHQPDLNGLYDTKSEDGQERKLGFMCYFEAPAPNHLGEGWLIELVNASGDEIELEVPAVVRDPATVRNSLLADITFDPAGDNSLLPNHLAPALSRLQERQRDLVRIDKVAQYGTPPLHPTVSIIIPLYGRIDFIEHQMAQFVHDPEISQADLIYVLDSPELSQAIFAAAPRLERLYRVPFRVATLKSNVGYSGANNAAVSLARGRLLLLLNPDVLPDHPQWLGKMVGFHDSKPTIGALAPKLLYEDDTIQHAGLFFYREPESGLWYNEHYYKGLHRTLPLAHITRPVPGVTAACLMIAADLYLQLGGLSGLYVQGDYEDSDLCLRLIENGRENWYLADIELYHLEGQSYPAGIRQLTGRYNRWLHSQHWSRLIESVMLEYRS
jgi:GT2 family glycosyltransferase